MFWFDLKQILQKSRMNKIYNYALLTILHPLTIPSTISYIPTSCNHCVQFLLFLPSEHRDIYI